jgi:hypothetical protein
MTLREFYLQRCEAEFPVFMRVLKEIPKNKLRYNSDESSPSEGQLVWTLLAIPHHFGTFPGIVQKADGFAAELKSQKINFYEMKPGETISFRGKQLIKGK